MVKFARVNAAVLALCLMPLAYAADQAAPAAAAAPAEPAAAATAGAQAEPVAWDKWRADNDVSDVASLQRGARNFMNYCNGCHSLKYERYQRMADDLKIPTAVLSKYLVAPGSNNLDYIGTAMPSADAANWFGKTPPDLSLITRARGVDYVYRFLKTFYKDASRPTGTNNLALPAAAMPAVLSDLEGVKQAVFKKEGDDMVFDHFVSVSPGYMTPEQFDGFVRDTVNFLDYVGEPVQVERRSMGIWVVLFLLLLTALAYLLKKEYWKDVH